MTSQGPNNPTPPPAAPGNRGQAGEPPPPQVAGGPQNAAVAVASRGPVEKKERALAPDLSRGLMLLFIALANTPWFLYGGKTGPTLAHPVDGSALDNIVAALIIVFVDNRIYPLFAFLFGYGIVQLYVRQRQAGVDDGDARRLLRRRHLWMLLFGFGHALLLWMGDVIGAWALAGLVVTWLFFRRQDRTLLIWAAVFFGVMTLFLLGGAIGTLFMPEEFTGGDQAAFSPIAMGVAVNGDPNYLSSMIARAIFWPISTISQGVLSMAAPVMLLLAFWAGRRRILENPENHLPLLRKVAAVGVPVGILGGLPQGLFQVGVVSEDVSWIFSFTQPFSGVIGATGYVALMTLIAHRIQSGGGAGSTSVVFLQGIGKRSLTNYLGQSVIFAPLLAAWGFALGGWIGSAATALIAVAGWFLLGLISYIWEQRDYRGPAETLLRRLVYRSSATPSQPR